MQGKAQAVQPNESHPLIELPDFIRAMRDHYAAERRTLPWRSDINPCRILVSEFMLQQTQVERVLGKYELFIETFPDFQALARAPLKDVLLLWQGSGTTEGL